MEVSNVGATGYQYEKTSTSSLKEEVRNTPESEKKNLGVIVEISKDSLETHKMLEAVKKRAPIYQGGKAVSTSHSNISGKSNDGMVSFMGARVTPEQSEKLQDVIKGLEEQGNSALGNSGYVGAYAQLGLKVSQLAYSCRELGLSDEVSGQIASEYSRQAEDEINKFNELAELAAKQIKNIRDDLYKKQGLPDYRKGIDSSASPKKDVVEMQREQKEWNNNAYMMFAKLDVSSTENFKHSFESALAEYKEYFTNIFASNNNEIRQDQIQINELVKRFNGFI